MPGAGLQYVLWKGFHSGVCAWLCGVLALIVVVAVHAAPAPGDDINERLQRQRLEREQQRLDDIRLPGEAPVAPEQAPPAVGPCFPLQRIEITDYAEPSRLTHQLAATLKVERDCYRIGDIQALQRELTNRLIARGYVTSRVLLPEQNLTEGVLKLVLVSGRIAGLEADEHAAAQISMALPDDRQQLLNLRDLEQAVENLERVPGQRASIDLKPSDDEAATTLVGTLNKPTPVSAYASVTDKRYGDDNHAVANAAIELGGLWNWPDRLRFSLNEDLDNLVATEAWGMSLDYDLGVGYWLYSFNVGRQAYMNHVKPALQTFEATGKTDTAQASAARILYRSQTARISAGTYAGYQDVGNFFEGALLNVSSYRQKKVGITADAMRLWQRYQASVSASIEYLRAGGAAANLPGGVSIADIDTQRYSLSLAGSRLFAWLSSRAQLRLTSQYSNEELFPVSRFSLTALVPGYDDISLSGNSGSTASFELSLVRALLEGRLSMRPYTSLHAGWIPGRQNEAGFDRLLSASLGAAINYRRLGVSLDCSWPWDKHSTVQSGNEYVLRSTLSYSF